MNQVSRELAEMWFGKFDNEITLIFFAIKNWENLPQDFKDEVSSDFQLALPDFVAKFEKTLNNLATEPKDIKYFHGVLTELEGIKEDLITLMSIDITQNLSDLTEILKKSKEAMQ